MWTITYDNKSLDSIKGAIEEIIATSEIKCPVCGINKGNVGYGGRVVYKCRDFEIKEAVKEDKREAERKAAWRNMPSEIDSEIERNYRELQMRRSGQ